MAGCRRFGPVLGSSLASLAVALLLLRADAPAPARAAVDGARSQGAAEVAAGEDAVARKRERLAHGELASFDSPQEAAEFYLAQRLPAGESRLPLEHLRAELEALRERERALAPLPQGPGGVAGWTELGPGNVGGRTRALVIDPTDPDVMYAAGVAGGVWKTVDGGASWAPADDFLLNLAVCSLAIDPNDPSVLYAGTGEGFFQASVFVRGLGVFKSVDAGATWTQLAGTVSGVPAGAFDYVNKLRVSPNDSSRVYAATRTGVWRSLDGGASWSVVLANPAYVSGPASSNGCLIGCTDLALRTDTSPDVLYASFGVVQSDGLFRSLDGGDSWQAYSVPASQGRTTIAFAPSDNDVMYLLMADNGAGGPLGQLVNVYRSADGGDTFTGQVDPGSLTGPWLLSNLILATGCIPGGTYAQGWHDNIIAVDPLDPDTVWVGGVDIFRSTDGGVNFEIPGYWIFYTLDPAPPYQIHPDHHEIVFHPDYDGVGNQTMYVCNDGGIFRTQNARAATSLEDCPLPADQPLPEIVWERLNNGYGVTQFYHGDAARDADVFIGGAQDNGSSRVQSSSTPDDWDLIAGGDGAYVAIDPTDSQVVYVMYNAFPNILKSTDGGDSFLLAVNGITDTDGIFLAPFAMDQTDPEVLWTGSSRPWRTTNGAVSWQPAGPDFAGPSHVSAIAVSPTDGDVVYMGFTNGYVVRTTNGTAPSPTWEVFANGLVGAWVSSLAVDPTDPDVAYCTYSTYGVPHVLRTVDGGQSWFSIDGTGATGVPDVPAHWLAVRPSDPQQLFLGTELGLLTSQDGGASWFPDTAGLPHTVVESLDFRDADTLVAFTHGRGAWLAELDPLAPGVARCFCDAPGNCLNLYPAGGCLNSTGVGAILTASGSDSVAQQGSDPLVLSVSQARPGKNGLWLQGAGGQQVPFKDGFLCVADPVIRMPPTSCTDSSPFGVPLPLVLDGTGALSTDDAVHGFALLDAALCKGDDIAAQAPVARHYQFWYRDGMGPCDSGSNLTNAVEVTWRP